MVTDGEGRLNRLSQCPSKENCNLEPSKIRRTINVGIALINLPFWDGVHHLFMVFFLGWFTIAIPDQYTCNPFCPSRHRFAIPGFA